MKEVLVNILQDQIEAEHICRTRLIEIASSLYLSDGEVLGILDQAREEVYHGQQFLEALTLYTGGPIIARSYLGPWAKTFDRAPLADPCLRIADFKAVERLMPVALKSAREKFRVEGETFIVKVYNRVIADEQAHQAFNRALFARLESHPTWGEPLRDRYHTLVTQKRYCQDLYRKAVEVDEGTLSPSDTCTGRNSGTLGNLAGLSAR